MKIKNAFPIQFISGTKRPENEQTYYEYQGQQVVRKYTCPQPPYNSSFRGAKDYNDEILEAWRNLSTLSYRKWKAFTDNWNRAIPAPNERLNPWLAFYKINFYRLLNDAGICIIPPGVSPNKSVVSIRCKAPTELVPELIFRFEVANLPYDCYHLLIKSTMPHHNFLHAFRGSEVKLIEGFGTGSIIDVPIKSGQFDHIVTSPKYNIQPGDNFYVLTQLLDCEYFPSKLIALPVEAEEELDLISTGDMWHIIPAPFNGGSPVNYCQSWFKNLHMEFLTSSHWEEKAHFLLPLNPGSIITGLRMLWRGSAPPGGALYCSLISAPNDSSFEHYDPYSPQINVAAASPYNITLSEVALDNIEVTKDDLWGIQIVTDSADRHFYVYSVGVKTSKRVY